jgi:hypothetical protein
MANWDQLRPFLAALDLDTYTGYDRIDTFAPKSRLNIRRVALLHPFDLLLYTGLALALRDDITRARLPQSEDRVFSYRADGAASEVLYDDSPSYGDFKRRVKDKVDSNPDGFVGITDIADFYPRIYQHRLVNALQAAAGPSKQDHIRALDKMLSRFSDGASYGIPIGPPASRPLVTVKGLLAGLNPKLNTTSDEIGTLHFAAFAPLEERKIGFFTIYDGTFDQYIMDFTKFLGPIFDVLAKFLVDPYATPTAKNVDDLIKWVAAHDLPPIGMYNAHPGLSVQDINTLLADSGEDAVSAKRSSDRQIVRVFPGSRAACGHKT